MYEDMNTNMKKIFRVFKRYRFYYKLTDFIMFFLIVYTLLYYFNAISLFSQHVEYYVVDAITLDKVIIIGLSGLISGLLVIILYMRKTPINSIEMLESRYEWMQERLQTAWDRQNEDNVVVADLIAQVTSQLKQVDLSIFLDKKHLFTRLLLSVVLTASVMGLTATQTYLNVTPENFNRLVENLGGSLPESTSSSNETIQENRLDEDIFGETSVASIEGENVEVTIIPGLGTSVTIRHTNEQDDVQFVPSQAYPVDIFSSAAADESYLAMQQISSQDRDLIRDYAVVRSKLPNN
jgi:hypothetical protein